MQLKLINSLLIRHSLSLNLILRYGKRIAVQVERRIFRIKVCNWLKLVEEGRVRERRRGSARRPRDNNAVLGCPIALFSFSIQPSPIFPHCADTMGSLRVYLRMFSDALSIEARNQMRHRNFQSYSLLLQKEETV